MIAVDTNVLARLLLRGDEAFVTFDERLAKRAGRSGVAPAIELL